MDIVTTAIVLAALALGAFIWRASPTVYRYKLTVEVDTPQSLCTGHAVHEVRWSRGVQITPEATTSSMTHLGEAAIVELPDDQVLFALLSPDGQETPMLAFGSARQGRRTGRSVKLLLPPAPPDPQGGSGYPRLVRFRDLDDPLTVEPVDPDDLAASFGEGVRLARITAQIVDEPITGQVRKRLKWLGNHPEPHLNRHHAPTDRSPSATLKHGDFWRSQ